MNVTVYSTTACSFCLQLEQWLQNQGVSYTKVLLDQDALAKDRVIAQSGFRSVPITRIDNNNTTQFILGFDVSKLQRALRQ